MNPYTIPPSHLEVILEDLPYYQAQHEILQRGLRGVLTGSRLFYLTAATRGTEEAEKVWANFILDKSRNKLPITSDDFPMP